MRALRFFGIAFAVAAFTPQQSTLPVATGGQSPSRQPVALPFGVGERIEYEVSGKALKIPVPLKGTGVMEVLPMDTVRGREAFHLRFTVRGGAMWFFTVNDRFESWLDARSLKSMRYTENKHEGSYKRNRTFEIVSESGYYTEDDGARQPTVADPLDDGSFLYFLRTARLQVGKTDSFPRYFRPDRNPVIITTERRDRINVAGKWWDAIVIRPTISTGDKGLFAKDSKAEIWLSDDDNHIILQMTSKLVLGTSLSLKLKSYRPATASRPAP
jgi:hypothetical protein